MRRISSSVVSLLLVACNGSTPGSDTSVGPTGSAGTDDPTGATGGSGANTGDGTDAGSGSDTASASGGTTGGPGSGTDGSTSTDGGPKFDVGERPDVGATCGGGGGGDLAFSYIWIANSSEGTVSKINTETLVEEGRYLTRPDGAGSPSRTSVNTQADVVVANRSGGLTKIRANASECPDSGGMAGVVTSQGAADIVSWDEEDCRAWHLPLAYADNRPVAWTAGEYNDETCAWENQMVWTSASQKLDGTIDVILVEGETGAIDDMVNLTGVPVENYDYGGYGAAVDENGDLWMTTLGFNLIHVELATLDYETFTIPARSYGMTYSPGHVWGCEESLTRFDTGSQQWDELVVPGHVPGNIHHGGCMEDGNGVLWKANGGWITGIDTASMQVVDEVQINEAELMWGISIDFNGNVWVVPRNGTTAYRVDPQTHQIDTVSGLVGAYTYSDMTGFALSNVADPAG